MSKMDKQILSEDGQIFLEIMNLLGMDVTGQSASEIVRVIRQMKAELAAYKKVAEAGMKLSQTLRHPVYGYDINEIWEPDSEEHKALGAAIADLDKVMK